MSMEEVEIQGCKSSKLMPEEFGGLTCFKKLIIGDVEGLEGFICSVSALVSLLEIEFQGCKSLKPIPKD